MASAGLTAPEALGLDTRDAFRAAGEHAVDALARDETLVVDCARLRSADSAGLATLIVLQRRAAARGARIRLRALHPELLALLQHTRLDTLFLIDVPPAA